MVTAHEIFSQPDSRCEALCAMSVRSQRCDTHADENTAEGRITEKILV